MILITILAFFVLLTAACGFLVGVPGQPGGKKPAQANRREPVPKATTGMPRYESRRWARACYHSGYITLQELNDFYASHPEDLSDPDR
jgi:hypothetical protein